MRCGAATAAADLGAVRRRSRARLWRLFVVKRYPLAAVIAPSAPRGERRLTREVKLVPTLCSKTI